MIPRERCLLALYISFPNYDTLLYIRGSMSKDIIETYKSANLKKIIILGIPKEIKPEEIINILNKRYNSEIPVTISKLIARENAKFYQLVIETEDWLAKELIIKKKIQIGFNTCKVQLYLPIIRCNKCQTYGHTNKNCRRTTTCQYCARNHASANCSLKNQPKRHRCANCIGTTSDFPHAADSSDCPCFYYHIQRRNTLAQQYLQNSTA